MLFSRYSWVVTLRSVLTNASWTITDLCSFVAIFAFILSFNYRQCRHLFYSVLHFFFQQLRFPKIIYFVLYAFVVFEPAEWKLSYSLHVENTKHEKNFSLNWLHFFFTWLFLYHKEVTRVSSSTSNFAWQFSHEWNQQHAILPQIQICKFGRTKFNTHFVLSHNEVLISYF